METFDPSEVAGRLAPEQTDGLSKHRLIAYGGCKLNVGGIKQIKTDENQVFSCLAIREALAAYCAYLLVSKSQDTDNCVLEWLHM